MFPSRTAFLISMLALLVAVAPAVGRSFQGLFAQAPAVPELPGMPGVPLRVPDQALAILGVIALLLYMGTNGYAKFREVRRRQDVEDAKALAETWRAEKKDLLAEIRRLKDSLAWQERRTETLAADCQRAQGEVDRLYREREQWTRAKPGDAPSA